MRKWIEFTETTTRTKSVCVEVPPDVEIDRSTMIDLAGKDDDWWDGEDDVEWTMGDVADNNHHPVVRPDYTYEDGEWVQM